MPYLVYTDFIKIVTIFFDVLIVWILLYYILKIVRSNSRTIQIFKGILFIFFAKLIAQYTGLYTLLWLTDNFLSWGFLAIIVIFQPEIRSMLERLGKGSVLSSISTLTSNERETLVKELMKSITELAGNMIGALISIEQSISLADYIKTGTQLYSEVSAELLTSIFATTTPLHDGAVIIKGDKIACASAYFPPTNMELPSRYGARHRAAMGISQISDAITIIVSEETGTVSIARYGELVPINDEQLYNYLIQNICQVEQVSTRASLLKRKKSPTKKTETKVETASPVYEPTAPVKATVAPVAAPAVEGPPVAPVATEAVKPPVEVAAPLAPSAKAGKHSGRTKAKHSLLSRKNKEVTKHGGK